MFVSDVHAKYNICMYKVGGLGMTVMNRTRWHEILSASESLAVWEATAAGVAGTIRSYKCPKVNYIERVPEPYETAPASRGQIQG